MATLVLSVNIKRVLDILSDLAVRQHVHVWVILVFYSGLIAVDISKLILVFQILLIFVVAFVAGIHLLNPTALPLLAG